MYGAYIAAHLPCFITKGRLMCHEICVVLTHPPSKNIWISWVTMLLDAVFLLYLLISYHNGYSRIAEQISKVGATLALLMLGTKILCDIKCVDFLRRINFIEDGAL
jgi:hypothetical protein